MSNSTNGNMRRGDISTKITSRPFISRQHPLNDPKDPFTAAKVNQELSDRMALKTYPTQGASSLCGPATLFYCLLVDYPKLYKRAVAELWRDGKTTVNNLKIEPNARTKNPKDLFKTKDELRILAIDWITLASLRDSTNNIMSYSSPFDQAAGITLPADIIDWFKKAGYRHVDTFVLDSSTNIIKINGYQNNSNYHVISLVNSGFISGQGLPTINFPNHWVMWTDQVRNRDGSPIRSDIKSHDAVKLKLFTWGEIARPIQANLSFAEFQKYHFQAIVIGR
ncbi:hypothetical protein [Psychrobacter sp. JB385]|uniref:hypothetical protein n=1 Tax=Psychrobacter sp. JB385 TaxID=1434841 RepID=UPI00097EE34C|nr:hypothetical protein [Psychrobacter sp. JB385]SJN26772.1 hypothetical protein CZ794_05525 [Psychrobacter sp. JB385]